MTPDYQRGVEAALAAIPSGDVLRDCIGAPGRLPDDHVADIRARIVRNARAAIDGVDAWGRQATHAPTPPPMADPGAVSEGDVRRFVELFEHARDHNPGGPLGSGPRTREPVRPIDVMAGIRAVVASVRAEATPPVDLSALREACARLRACDGEDVYARRMDVVHAALMLTLADAPPPDAAGSVPEAAFTTARENRVRDVNGNPWPQEPAEPVRCSGRYELASGFTHCVLAAGHDTDHMDARGGMWSKTIDEEGGRHG